LKLGPSGMLQKVVDRPVLPTRKIKCLWIRHLRRALKNQNKELLLS